MTTSKRKSPFDPSYSPYGYSQVRGNADEWRQSYEDMWMGEEETVVVLDKDNPYVILGLKQGAKQSEVKSAWRQYALKHHPDHGGNEETFKKGLAAYSFLNRR